MFPECYWALWVTVVQIQSCKKKKYDQNTYSNNWKSMRMHLFKKIYESIEVDSR